MLQHHCYVWLSLVGLGALGVMTVYCSNSVLTNLGVRDIRNLDFLKIPSWDMLRCVSHIDGSRIFNQSLIRQSHFYRCW